MKIEMPKKPNKEASKWEEHMQKKSHGAAPKGGEAEITPAKKRQSVAPAKGKVEVRAPAKEAQRAEAKAHEHAAHMHEHKHEEKKAPVKEAVKVKEVAKPVKAQKAAPEKEASVEERLADMGVLRHPLVTEKAVNMIEGENKLTFVVERRGTKTVIKGAVESLYKVRVKKVSILNDMKARKRAIVTLNKEFKASDIATKLGVI